MDESTGSSENNYKMLMSIPKSVHNSGFDTPVPIEEHIVEVEADSYNEAFYLAAQSLERKFGLEHGENGIRAVDYTTDPNTEIGPPNSPNRNLWRI